MLSMILCEQCFLKIRLNRNMNKDKNKNKKMKKMIYYHIAAFVVYPMY